VSLGSRTTRPGSDPTDGDALSISDLYGRIDRALKGALPGEVWVSGEVRSFNVSSRGHCYLDLVDPVNAQDSGTPVLKVVCWSGRWSRVRTSLDQLGITLEAGLVVRVRGEVQLYKPRGDISFILSELDTDALLGKVAAERARLIKALVDEDLFDRNRRVPVPRLPLRVGLVASPGTEGYRDSSAAFTPRGWPSTFVPCPPRCRAVRQRRRWRPPSGACSRNRATSSCRPGGGSKADLATFDAEPVARAVATSAVPVWTGIGHTGDQSVADEVANRSFITPTECGQELARLATDFWRTCVEAGWWLPGRHANRWPAPSARSTGSGTPWPPGPAHRSTAMPTDWTTGPEPCGARSRASSTHTPSTWPPRGARWPGARVGHSPPTRNAFRGARGGWPRCRPGACRWRTSGRPVATPARRL